MRTEGFPFINGVGLEYNFKSEGKSLLVKWRGGEELCLGLEGGGG